jgi:hypothetical protein
MKSTPQKVALVLRGFALLLVASCGLSGCAVDHIRQLREAEQTFSQAAEQENRARFAQLDPTAGAVVPSAASPGSVTSVVSDAAGYRLAAQMTRKLIAGHGPALREDNLLCTAQVVQAFSLWRLGEGAAAADAASADCGDTSKLPRESVLLAIVPALVKVDDANALLRNPTRDPAEVAKTGDLIDAALKTLGEQDDRVPRDHPVRAYLFMTRLAALSVQFSSPSIEGLTGDAETAQLQKALDRAGPLLEQYRKYLYCNAGYDSGNEHASVKYWRRLFGDALPVKPAPDCKVP